MTSGNSSDIQVSKQVSKQNSKNDARFVYAYLFHSFESEKDYKIMYNSSYQFIITTKQCQLLVKFIETLGFASISRGY